MSTAPNTTPATNTAAPTAVLNPTSKLTNAVYSYLDLSIKVTRKFDSLVEQALHDQRELSYNRDQCKTVLQTAYRSSFEKLGKADKLEGDSLKAYVETGMKKEGPNISKVLSLAFPKTEEAATELAKAEAAGLGINARLEVARGNTTVAAIEQERANKAAGAAKETARPPAGSPAPSANKPAPQAPFPETPEVSKLTPKERVENSLVALLKYAESLGLERNEAIEFIGDWCAEQVSATEAPEEASAQ